MGAGLSGVGVMVVASPQSRHSGERPALAVFNPRTQALLDELRDAVQALQVAFETDEVDSADALVVAAQIHQMLEQVRALHYTAVGMADRAGLWGVAGYTSTNAWLRHTHLLGGRGATRVSRTARWLAHQPHVSQALGVGEITEAHVQAMRVVVTASPARAAAFAEMAAQFVEVARNADAEYLGRVMRSWGDVVDERAGDDSSRRSHEKRGIFLSPVADGWDLRGWLSGADGAELAGILNERVAQTRRDNPDLNLSAAQRRADALLDIARAGADGEFSPAQRDRARVLVLLPWERLAGCQSCRSRLGEEFLRTVGERAVRASGAKLAGGSSQCADCGGTGERLWGDDGGRSGDDARRSSGGNWGSELPGGEPPDGAAAQWRTGNGVGRGNLSIADARRLSCDGQIQRVVLSPQSAVLDVGRTQRLVTPAIRTALEVRDGGCVIPGCDRPSGWCEAHHLTHWSAGGETALHNLALTCSRHHHEIHQDKWRVRIDGKGVVKVSERIRRPTPLRC